MAANGNIKVLFNTTNQRDRRIKKKFKSQNQPGKTNNTSLIRLWTSDEDKIRARVDKKTYFNGVAQVTFSDDKLKNGVPRYVMMQVPWSDPRNPEEYQRGIYYKDVPNVVNPYKTDKIDPWGDVIYDGEMDMYPQYSCGHTRPGFEPSEHRICPNQMSCVKIGGFSYPPGDIDDFWNFWGYCTPSENVQELYNEVIDDGKKRLEEDDLDIDSREYVKEDLQKEKDDFNLNI